MSGPRPGRIEVSVQAGPQDGASWTDLARRAQDAGLRALLVSDHPGSGPSPFVALAAAAAVTTTLRLGTYVVNAGVREPLLVAADVATLDVVSGGRAELGLGAGHTPAEWEMTGRARPGPRERVRRLVAGAAALRTLLDGGAVPAGDVGALRDVVLDAPRPVQPHVPLLLGGGHPDLLAWGGAHADAVGLSGLGATLADGHSHAVTWTPQRVDAQVGAVRRAAAGAGVPAPALEALVQVVDPAGDREQAVAPQAAELGGAPADLLAVPYLWIGSPGQVAEQLHAARERWGITRWVVRAGALDAALAVLARV